MPRVILSTDVEKEMRELLNLLSLPSIIQILEKQIEDLPLETQQFYLDEIDLWGSIGDKQQLISAIINITEEAVGLDEVMNLFDVVTQGLPAVQAQTRYMPTGVAPGFEWSQETNPTERLKWMKYYQYPGYYSKEEKELIQPHPEQDYADPDLLKREQEEGKVLGAGPIIPEALPKMNELNPQDQKELKKLMEAQIHEIVQPHGARPVPRPFLMELAYDYLYITGNDEAAERFRVDGVSSRTRFFNTTAILKRMFDEMPLEDLYLYWNSIVNYRELPWVSEQYALDRFGGGELGHNIGTIYEDWKNQGQQEETPYIAWPEEMPWAERVPIAEEKQWEYS